MAGQTILLSYLNDKKHAKSSLSKKHEGIDIFKQLQTLSSLEIAILSQLPKSSN